MKTSIPLIIALCLMSLSVQAAGIAEVLQSIEKNNLELQSVQKSYEISLLETKAANIPDNPTIEYSRLYPNGGEGDKSSDLEVKQAFDFPSLYVSRAKAAKLKQEAATQQYAENRCNILLQAKLLCLDLIYINKADSIFNQRHKNSEQLLELFSKRMENGDATAIELNKIKIDCMKIGAEMARLETERQKTRRSLEAFNGNIPINFTAQEYDEQCNPDYVALYDKLLSSDYSIKAAEAGEKTSQQELKVSRQNWIPSFEIGYVRSNEASMVSNGFIVGASIPLYSSANKVKTAKAVYSKSQIEHENAKAQAENNAQSLIDELKSLNMLLAAYDIELINSSLNILSKAVENGEISVVDYYTEAEYLFSSLQEYLLIERQVQGLYAELLKYEL